MTSREQLVKVIAESLVKRRPDYRFIKQLAAYLIDSHQTDKLDSILRDVRQYLQDSGYFSVDLVSAYPLSPVVINDLKIYLKSQFKILKKLTFNQKIDPELIGGMKLELANQQLDISTRSRLNDFKRLTLSQEELS